MKDTFLAVGGEPGHRVRLSVQTQDRLPRAAPLAYL
jgi:hypothetical protein